MSAKKDPTRDALRDGMPARLHTSARDIRSNAHPTERAIASATRRPRLRWVLPLERVGQEQTAYHLRLTRQPSDPRDPAADALVDETCPIGDPWFDLPLDLPAHHCYQWSVRCCDDRGDWSQWAEPCDLETGPLSLQDWTATWVSHPALCTLRAERQIAAAPIRARLHLSGQGLVQAAVNEVPVNRSTTDVTRTDYVRALYRSYDVTDLCQAGNNTLDLTLAGGEWARSGEDPRVLAEIILTFADGTEQRIGTGPGMLYRPSEVTDHQPFYLERHDPNGDDRFAPASELRVHEAVGLPLSPAQPPADVQPDPTPPLHNVMRIDPVEIGRPAGTRVYDVGVNIAGRIQLDLVTALPKECTVRLVHGEHLDAAGRLDTTNLNMPFDHGRIRQTLEYVGTGEPSQRCVPWFSYHGFRYVEIQGLSEDAEITLTVYTHHTDLEQVSTLATGDDQVDRLTARAQRTLLNNVHGIPEDCPTREQAGWTGDAASVAEFVPSAFDVEAFYAKWMVDLRTSQQPDGAIPGIAPDIRSPKSPAEPVWGSALHRVLINHWYHYGDQRVVLENLPALRRWADFQLSCRDEFGVVSRSPISYGSDWLALQQTPPPIHHTAAVIDCLLTLADLEHDCGTTGAATARLAQVQQLRRASRDAFVDERSSVVGNGSQGSYACAIEAGFLSGVEIETAADRIEADVRSRGNRVSSGFAATRTVVRALAHAGRSQTLFDVVQQRQEPGVGAMADHGPGTLWECWWIDPYNTGTGSLDHVGLGGPFASWAWQQLGGIRPTAPGFAEFEVAPQFITGVDHLDLRTETVRGTIELSYRRVGDELVADLTVPVSATATVRLPGHQAVAAPGHHSYRVPWPATAAAVEPATDDWRSPTTAASSADVRGNAELLIEAVAQHRYHPVGGRVDAVLDGIVCMPVPHAQERGPVLRIVGDTGEPAAPTVRLTFDQPLDLTEATFAYAMIDLCLENSASPLDTLIVLHGSDHTSIRRTGRIWPAGWNRASIDLGDWPGRTAVVSIEAGVAFANPESTGGRRPAAFHLGEVGYSTARRTW